MKTIISTFLLTFKHMKCAIHFQVFTKRCSHIQSVTTKHQTNTDSSSWNSVITISEAVSICILKCGCSVFACSHVCKEYDFINCPHCLVIQKTYNCQTPICSLMVPSFKVNTLQCRDRKRKQHIGNKNRCTEV